jgi:hypothetical protein
MAITRLTSTTGYLIATDNTYSLPPHPYSSNIASVMDQSLNYSASLAPITESIAKPDATTNAWLIPPTAATNVAFNTFNDDAAVATGKPQQMSPFIDINTAVWGVYFGAIPEDGQLAAAYGKIQVYGAKVTGLAGNGNDPENVTSLAGLQALFLKIGDKYVDWGGANLTDGTAENNIISAVHSGIVISLNGCIITITDG